MNSFIFSNSNGQKETFVCACCKNEISNTDEKIPIFHSWYEVQKNGWFYTRDPEFCPPGKEDDGVWICPKCVKKYVRLYN